jgi:hypothetical protein
MGIENRGRSAGKYLNIKNVFNLHRFNRKGDA